MKNSSIKSRVTKSGKRESFLSVLPQQEFYSFSLNNDNNNLPSYLNPKVKAKMSSVLVSTYPGTSLNGKSVEMLSNGIRSNRTCSIQISNHLNLPLTSPSFYNFLGVPYYNPQSVIHPKTREACSFAKKRDAPLGVKGVLTYQVGDTPLRFAIMFSVPYNQLAERNHFGIAFLDDSSVNSGLVGSSLFNRMYNDETFYGRPDRKMCPANMQRLWIDNGDYGICATMNERGKAIIKLDVVPM